MQIKRLVLGPLFTNCYLLTANQETLIIDPGSDLEKVSNEVRNKKVMGIVLTHYHWDHTLAAPALRKETQSKIFAGEGEKEFLSFEPDVLLREGEEIRVGNRVLRVVCTPGHTPGSICLLGEGVLFSGDTWFKDGVGRTDLPGGSFRELNSSLKKLEKIVKPGMKIYPGHGESFTFRSL